MENKTRKGYTFLVYSDMVDFVDSLKSPSSIIKELIIQDMNCQLDYDVLREAQRELPTGNNSRINQKWKQINLRFNLEKEQETIDYLESIKEKTFYLKSLLLYAKKKNITMCNKTSRTKFVNVSFSEETYNKIFEAAHEQGKSLNNYLYDLFMENLNN